jgi:predicted acylesterase/phospholipase RssA
MTSSQPSTTNVSGSPTGDAVCFTAGPEGATFGGGTIHAYLVADRPPPVIAAGISAGAVVAAAMHASYKGFMEGGGTEAARWTWFRRYLETLCDEPFNIFWDGLPDQSDFFADHPPIADPATPEKLRNEEHAALAQRYRLVQFGRWFARIPLRVSQVARLLVTYVRQKEHYPSPRIFRLVAFWLSALVVATNVVLHVARSPNFYREPKQRARNSSRRAPRPLFGYAIWGFALWTVFVGALIALSLILWITAQITRSPLLERAASFVGSNTWSGLGVFALSLLGLLLWRRHFVRQVFRGVGVEKSLIHNYHLRRRLETLFGDWKVPATDDGSSAPRLVLVAAPLQTLRRNAPGKAEQKYIARQLYARSGARLADVLTTTCALPGIFEPTTFSLGSTDWELPLHAKKVPLQLIDGAVIRQNPLPALFRYLRDNQALAQRLLLGRPSIHVVYSVPAEPRGDRTTLPDKDANVVDVGLAALRLSRRCDTQLEVIQTNFLSRLESILGSPGSKDEPSFPFIADEIAPASTATQEPRLGWSAVEAQANVAAGCKRTLQVLYADQLAATEVRCAQLISAVAPRRRAALPASGKPGLAEVCKHCDGLLRARPIAPPVIQTSLSTTQFPQLHRRALNAPRIVFVASGGVFRGAFHGGMVGALWTLGMKPDLVVGASVGNLMGGVLAAMFQAPAGQEGQALSQLENLVTTLLHVDDTIALTKTLKSAMRELGLRGRAIRLSPNEVRRAVRRGSRSDAGYAATGAPPALIDAIAEMFLLPLHATTNIARMFVAGHITEAVAQFGAQVKKETLRRLGVEPALLGASLIKDSAWRLMGGGYVDFSKRQPYMQKEIAFFATATDLGSESLFWLGDPGYRPDEPYDFVEAALASSAFPAVFSPRRESDIFPGSGERERRFADGGMFDNLPFEPALKVLADAQQDPSGLSPAQLRDRIDYPDLFLAGALDVNPETNGEHTFDDLVKISRRGAALQKNVKIRGFQKLSARVDRVLRSLPEDLKGIQSADKDFLSTVINAAVLPVFPADQDHLNPTFAFCASTGLKKDRVARSIANGCFETLSAIANNVPGAPDRDLTGRALDGLREVGRVRPIVPLTVPTKKVANGQCPFFGEKSETPISCPFHAAGDDGRFVHKTCIADTTHLKRRAQPRAGAT